MCGDEVYFFVCNEVYRPPTCRVTMSSIESFDSEAMERRALCSAAWEYEDTRESPIQLCEPGGVSFSDWNPREQEIRAASASLLEANSSLRSFTNEGLSEDGTVGSWSWVLADGDIVVASVLLLLGENDRRILSDGLFNEAWRKRLTEKLDELGKGSFEAGEFDTCW